MTELDHSGKPVTLDDFDPPPLPKKSQPPAEDVSPKEPTSDLQTAPRPLEDVVGKDQFEAVKELSQQFITSLDPTVQPPVLLGEVEKKEDRREMHMAVRHAFPMLKTRTVRNEEVRFCLRRCICTCEVMPSSLLPPSLPVMLTSPPPMTLP